MENADEPESGKNPEKTPPARSTSRSPSARGSASRKPAAGGKPAARSKPAAAGKPSAARKPATPKAASSRAAATRTEESDSVATVEAADEVVENAEPAEKVEPAQNAQPAENDSDSAESVDRAPFAVPRLSVPKISMGAGRRGSAAQDQPESIAESDAPEAATAAETSQEPAEDADAGASDAGTDTDVVTDAEQVEEAESAVEAAAESETGDAETGDAETGDRGDDDTETGDAPEPGQDGTDAGTDLEVASGSIAPPEYEPVAGADLVPVPMPADAGAMLSIRGLTKRFDDTVAVRAIDLDVPAGSIFGIVGPNGAGKTTTLSMITGLLRPDAGTVTVHGADVWAEPVAAKRQLGVLPDRLRLFDRLTGSQLLYYSAVLRGLDGAVAKQRVADLAAVFRIEDALGRLVSDYSTGMTKKVALAAAMIHAPRMLVLDEPFESVDPVSAATVMGILRDYVAAGGTVLLSSHSMALVERICDRVAVIVDGDVLAVGSIDEVRGDVSLEERFVQLAGSTAELEGVEWLHTFSD